jgi:hypothetical protein
MNTGLKRCYDAFERLKNGNAQMEVKAVDGSLIIKYEGLPQDQITPSVVSQEAGWGGGYLKAARTQHQPLISMIGAHVKDHKDTTIGKGAAIKLEKNKTKSAKDKESVMRLQLEASLGRELQLYHNLKKVEQELAELKAKTITQLPL